MAHVLGLLQTKATTEKQIVKHFNARCDNLLAIDIEVES